MSKQIGIEIDNDEICMAQYLGNTTRIVVKRLPENLIKDQEIVAPELLVDILKQMRKEGGFSGNKCSIILPDSCTYFRTLSMPPISDAQLKLNLPYEFRDFVGGEALAYNFDYAVDHYEYDGNGNVASLHLVAAAARKSEVNGYAQLLKKAGLQLEIAIPREMAMLNIVHAEMKENNSEKTGERCLIDIGYDNTRISIVDGSRLEATKTIDIGCHRIDLAIADTMKIDPYLAATYRESNYEDIQNHPACVAIYEQISLEILKTINFFRYENQQSNLSKAAICGSGTDITPLVESILSYIQFERADLREWLPDECLESADAHKAVFAIGATL